jgi:hypothetical protein
MTYTVNHTVTKTGRQNGYAVVEIETGKTVATFRNRDHSFSWRYAKNAAEAEAGRLNRAAS